MNKYLLLLLLVACGTEKKESPRNEIAKQQTELKNEYKRLQDSFKKAEAVETYGLPDSVREQYIQAEGAYNKRLDRINKKSDSLSNLMKAFEMDSIAKSK